MGGDTINFCSVDPGQPGAVSRLRPDTGRPLALAVAGYAALLSPKPSAYRGAPPLVGGELDEMLQGPAVEPRGLVSLKRRRRRVHTVRRKLPEVSMRLFWVLIAIWLILGAVAAGQRHYYTTASVDCAGAGTIAVTILFGPANYLGASPKLTCH